MIFPSNSKSRYSTLIAFIFFSQVFVWSPRGDRFYENIQVISLIIIIKLYINLAILNKSCFYNRVLTGYIRLKSDKILQSVIGPDFESLADKIYSNYQFDCRFCSVQTCWKEHYVMNYNETITPGHFAMVKRWVTLKSISGFVKKRLTQKWELVICRLRQ